MVTGTRLRTSTQVASLRRSKLGVLERSIVAPPAPVVGTVFAVGTLTPFEGPGGYNSSVVNPSLQCGAPLQQPYQNGGFSSIGAVLIDIVIPIDPPGSRPWEGGTITGDTSGAVWVLDKAYQCSDLGAVYWGPDTYYDSITDLTVPLYSYTYDSRRFDRRIVNVGPDFITGEPVTFTYA